MTRYINYKQAAERIGVSEPTWWRWVAQGKAPAPYRFSAGCTRWSLEEVERWEAEQKVQGVGGAERRAATA